MSRTPYGKRSQERGGRIRADASYRFSRSYRGGQHTAVEEEERNGHARGTGGDLKLENFNRKKPTLWPPWAHRRASGGGRENQREFNRVKPTRRASPEKRREAHAEGGRGETRTWGKIVRSLNGTHAGNAKKKIKSKGDCQRQGATTVIATPRLLPFHIRKGEKMNWG